MQIWLKAQGYANLALQINKRGLKVYKASPADNYTKNKKMTSNRKQTMMMLKNWIQ